MTKPLSLISFLLICSCFASAQDLINFEKINAAMEPALIVSGKDTFHYKRISLVKLNEVCNYLPYNSDRKAACKELNRDIDRLDGFLSDAVDKNQFMYESKLSNLEGWIIKFKRDYPKFDISSYDAICISLVKQLADEKENEKIKEKEQEIAHQKYIDSMEVAKEQKEKQATIDQAKEDSLRATAMLTVEENGQEYEIGYQKEYLAQMGFASEHRHLCRFIGFKYYWVTYIPKYLIEEETFDLESAKLGDDGYLIIKMKPGFRKETFYGKFQIKAKVNDDDRVTALIISGNPTSLMHLFLWYWPSTPSLAKNTRLKTGVTYKKMIFDEDIIFNYGAAPTITIKKRK